MKPLQYKQWELWLYPFLLTCWTENKCVLTMCEYVSWLIPTMFSFPYLAAIYPHFRLVKPWKCNALNCSSKNIETNYTCLANVDIETNIDKLHIFVPWLPPLLLIAKGRFASELRGCLWTSVSHHLHWPAKMAIFVGFDLQKRGDSRSAMLEFGGGCVMLVQKLTKAGYRLPQEFWGLFWGVQRLVG